MQQSTLKIKNKVEKTKFLQMNSLDNIFLLMISWNSYITFIIFLTKESRVRGS